MLENPPFGKRKEKQGWDKTFVSAVDAHALLRDRSRGSLTTSTGSFSPPLPHNLRKKFPKPLVNPREHRFRHVSLSSHPHQIHKDKLTNSLLTQPLINRDQRRHNILQELALRLLFLDNLPQLSRLLEIPIRDLGGVALHLAVPDLVALGIAVRLSEIDLAEARAHVVRVAAVVAVDGARAVALVGAVDGGERLVGGELLVVCAQAVASGVRVGEHSRLEDCWGVFSGL